MSYKRCAVSILMLIIVAAASTGQAEETKNAAASGKIPKGAKVYIAPIADGFDTYLKTAIADKKVPIEVVGNRDQAEFEIIGVSETKKASTAKKAIFLDWRSDEEASIQVANLKSGEVTWAYSVHKQSSAHGKKSTANACAKHLKEAIESNN